MNLYYRPDNNGRLRISVRKLNLTEVIRITTSNKKTRYPVQIVKASTTRPPRENLSEILVASDLHSTNHRVDRRPFN